MTQWHIATIEWMPERITFDLDGYTWTTTDPQAIPTHPMRWVLQTETELNRRAPDRAVSGHVYIDWVAVWARA
jgi:beta-glucanase (GH16 family)